MPTSVLKENQKKNTNGKRKSKVLGKVSAIVTMSPNMESIEVLADSITKAIESSKYDAEIIFIDSGNTKISDDQKSKALSSFKNIKIVKLRSMASEAAAFDAGLQNSLGENILYINSAKRMNPTGINALLEELSKDLDLVMGWRHERKDSSLNQFISKVFNWFIKKLYHLKLKDINSGVFVARRAMFEELSIYGDMNIFLPVLAARKGYKVGEAKVEQVPGEFRQSKFISEYVQRILDFITVIFLMNYSKRPLHFLGFLGVIFTILGVLMNGYLFIYRFFGFGGIAGRPLLLLGALLLVIGVQMISIGLIGEIIIFTHAREQIEYSIEEILE